MHASTSIFRAAIRFPFLPAAAIRILEGSAGAAWAFSLLFALAVSLFAGGRAALQAPGTNLGMVRFATSLVGFVLFSVAVWAVGRWLGGKARLATVAAALVGCTLPFLLVDGVWILLLGLRQTQTRATDLVVVGIEAARILERASWAWALVLLVFSLARAQRFSLLRAVANLLLVALVLAGAAAATLALRALAG